jgi:hypothetical protein
MQLTIVDINFLNSENWIFKLKDLGENNYYILNSEFYKQHNLISPIDKTHLDYLDKGDSITAIVKELKGKNIVIEILKPSFK